MSHYYNLYATFEETKAQNGYESKLTIKMVEPEFKIIFEFIHSSFQNCLLNTYYIPDTVSGTGFNILKVQKGMQHKATPTSFLLPLLHLHHHPVPFRAISVIISLGPITSARNFLF